MAETISIAPVTRIEGHAKITVRLDDAGEVADARLHVTEFRGFEKFCLGRSFREMPAITERICGICPVSHALASAKAGDALLGVQIPPAAVKLRRLMHCAQFVQSHALSFFLLSGPDLLLGMESDPRSRNFIGFMEAMPRLAREGLQLRQFGQDVIRTLADRSVHPAWAVPGGVREPLTVEKRDRIAEGLPQAVATTREALNLCAGALERMTEERSVYGNFPSLYLGLVGRDGGLEHYDGALRLADADGSLLEDGIEPSRYSGIIAETQESWSYLKFPYYRTRGAETDGGMYRVGPLARLNVARHVATPRADEEFSRYRRFGEGGGPVQGSFCYHLARLIELLFCLETMEILLDDREIMDRHLLCSSARINGQSGVGVLEAPRGVLIHDYRVDDHGLLTAVNLIIATGHNNRAMNRTILQIARHYLRGGRLDEGLLNRVEHGIRCYDPCLSCSTHVAGRMPVSMELYGPDGELLDSIVEGAGQAPGRR